MRLTGRMFLNMSCWINVGIAVGEGAALSSKFKVQDLKLAGAGTIHNEKGRQTPPSLRVNKKFVFN
jgi:hypothetical protein